MTERIQGLTAKLIEVDNQISKLNKYLAQLRQQKTIIEKELIGQLQINNLNNHQITMNNHKIRMCEECNYTPLTYSFLEEQLNRLFPGSEAKVKAMVKNIKSQRSKKIGYVIKIK
jgi:hypothetical protein